MSQGKHRLLVVDDDESVRDMLGYLLKDFGQVDTASNPTKARELFGLNEYDLVLQDYMMQEGEDDGLVLLKEYKELQPKIEVLMITHVREVRVAVEAMKQGAFDYINKEFDPGELRASIQRALDKIQSKKEILYLRSEVQRLTSGEEFILGTAPKMQEVVQVLKRAATTSATVLLQGESGTGKELAARFLHRLSNRSEKPFVAINMASVPDNLVESTLFGHEKGAFTGASKTTYGKFELANGGTLFCDEIAELKLELQSKLLRAIQENEIERVGSQKPIRVDVRLVCATNQDLREMVQKGLFREDLYYRLNVIPVKLPSLAERIEDIGLFVDLFLKRYNRKYHRNLHITPGALAVLSHYDWPGNIRELENLIARLVAIHPAEELLPEDIPLDYQSIDGQSLPGDGDHLKAATEAFERGYILRMLEQENWHQEKTAAKLGVHRKTLENKINKYKLRQIVDEKQAETRGF